MVEHRHQEGQEVGWETFSSLSQIFLLRSPDGSLGFGHSRQERLVILILLNLLVESSCLTSLGRSYGTQKGVSNTKESKGGGGGGVPVAADAGVALRTSG
jgi:hypothetical protein